LEGVVLRGSGKKSMGEMQEFIAIWVCGIEVSKRRKDSVRESGGLRRSRRKKPLLGIGAKAMGKGRVKRNVQKRVKRHGKKQ